MTDKPYTINQLAQGGREWLEWRHQGIGASDAPVIMGENPWKKVAKLFQEKRNPPGEDFKSPAMIRGIQLEPEARNAYIEKTGTQVNPLCIQSNEYAWMRASLDGISEDRKRVVEIKCGESVYKKTASNLQVPTYYYGQLQHILAVTGLESIDFWCYLPGRPSVLVSEQRNDEYIKKLIEKESDFWESIMS